MKRLVHRIEYLSLRSFFALCCWLPWRAADGLARRVGDLLFSVIRIRRDVTMANLAASFPDRSNDEVLQLARSCYRNFAKTAVQFARLRRLSNEELLKRNPITGLEHLDSVVSLNRGAILVTGHFGNWEWFGSTISALGHPTCVVVGEQRNRLVERLMDEVRIRRGLKILNAEHDLRGILEALQHREFVAIVADQDAGREGLFVDFLGRPASTAVGPVRLARRFGVPILFGVGIHAADGTVRGELQKPFLVPQEGNEDEMIRAYTNRWVRLLEAYVLRYPDQWFWMHRRWKTRPESGRQTKEAEVC